MRSNHGGVCLFHCSRLRVSRITLPTYDSDECICASVQGLGIKTTAVVLYRPGGEAVSDKFFIEFADILERLAGFSSVLIAGDLNMNLDISDLSDTRKFNALLDEYNYTQRIQTATHVRDHLLDVLLLRDLSTEHVDVSPAGGLSDHSLIVGNIELPLPHRYDTVT